MNGSLTDVVRSATSVVGPLSPLIGDEFLIRDPLQVLPGGAIACIASIPEYAIAHIMEGNYGSFFDAAQEAARVACHALGDSPPAAVLIFGRYPGCKYPDYIRSCRTFARRSRYPVWDHTRGRAGHRLIRGGCAERHSRD